MERPKTEENEFSLSESISSKKISSARLLEEQKAARCWRGPLPKYRHLLADQDIGRWYDNVCRGSKITADVYLRRIGHICSSRGIGDPTELLERAKGGGERWAYNFLIDVVTQLEKEGKAGSYIESNLKAAKSWLAHNGIEIKGRIKVKGAQDTPTLRNKHALSNSELALFFSSAPQQTRSAAALVAEAGVRLESVGNYEGTDGLRIGDLPEMRVNNDDEKGGSELAASFSKIPTIVVVRQELSKARHQYFTFLAAEGCRYLAEYLTQRMKAGERLDESTPLIAPGKSRPSKNAFVRTTLLGDLIRKRLRACRISARPYDLRSTFATQLMLAESRGATIRDYRVFFMGHRGDIEHTYTTNKRVLQPEVVEDMRSSFARAQKYIQAVQQPAFAEDDISTQIKKQMLLTVGYKHDEIAKMDLTEASDEEIQDMIKQKLFAVMVNNGQRQKVVPAKEVEKLMGEGWEWMGNLSDGRAVLRLPSSS